MKRIICLLVVLMLCLSIAAPAYAAEDTFVPSISVKDSPELVPFGDEFGNLFIGKILDEEDNVIDNVPQDCLVITPISEAETSEKIPEDARETLISVYNQLVDGSMKLPYEKVSAELNASNMVIRELVDISWLCEDHPETLAANGITLELTFDLGVRPGEDVVVMTYINGQWNPIEKVVNNGDGTVTCEFEEICPVAFSVSKDAGTNYPQTGDNMDIALWSTLLAVSFVAIAAMFIFYRKSAKKN